MIMFSVKTSAEEADAILKGERTFIFRDSRYRYGFGDRITFAVYNNGRPRPHPIDNIKFQVTYVTDEAPIEKGWKVIGFKRLYK